MLLLEVNQLGGLLTLKLTDIKSCGCLSEDDDSFERTDDADSCDCTDDNSYERTLGGSS